MVSKRVLITGSSSGIGEAFVHWYADSASELMLVGRNKYELDRVASNVRSRGVHVEMIFADLSHKMGVKVLAPNVEPLMCW